MLWKYKEAKARLEDVVELAQRGETQLIEVRGKVEVAVLSMSAFRTLMQRQRKNPHATASAVSKQTKTRKTR
jgi:prevent-host-death family protein